MPLRLAIPLALVLTSSATAQVAPLDAVAILHQMSQHYRAASTWAIDGTIEYTSTSDLSRLWSKTIFSAEQDGDRYRFEGASTNGRAVHISDGTTVWHLHPDAKTYTAIPAAQYTPPKMWPIADSRAAEAGELRKLYADLADHYSAATRLPDDDMEGAGSHYRCFVIRVDSKDRTSPKVPGTSQLTLWIDQATWTVRKSTEHVESTFFNGEFRQQNTGDTLTIYSRADLKPKLSPDLFHFDPPPELTRSLRSRAARWVKTSPTSPHPMFSSPVQMARKSRSVRSAANQC